MMSREAMKHTPGPWYADTKGGIWRRKPSDLYENGGGVAGDKQLATVWKGWVNEGEIGYPLGANACLIAAAPDLLEALKEQARIDGLIAEAVAKEREACARLCDIAVENFTSISLQVGDDDGIVMEHANTCNQLATAIRARGQA